MTEAKRFFDPCLYLAYVFILFSYLTTNVLALRLNLVLSAILFIVWAVIYPHTAIQIDTLIYNALFIFINLYNSIPLFKEVLPVKMTSTEELCYARDFKDFLTRREFKYFISHFKKTNASLDQTAIINKGMYFQCLIYIAKINKGSNVYITKDIEKIKSLKEGSWLGIIEYMLHEGLKAGETKILWGISAILERTKDYTTNYSKHEMIVLDGIGIDYYIIDIETLFKLFDDLDYPFIFKNALQALWLIYTTNYIIEQDSELLKLTDLDQEIVKNNSNLKENNNNFVEGKQEHVNTENIKLIN